MDQEQRKAHLRRIALSGGLACKARYGSAFYARIGKLGFRASMDAGWGPWLWQVRLAASYQAKFGHAPSPDGKPSPTLSRAQLAHLREASAARRTARKLMPRLGGCQWPGCTAPGAHRHHVKGWKNDPAATDLRVYCAAHHRLVHVLQRKGMAIPQ